MDKEQQHRYRLEVKDLTVVLGDQPIIEHLSFAVEEGEHLTVIGPNGSGKTTLFRALIGAIPSHGSITWLPGTILGYVPQKLDIQRDVPLSLKDFLESKKASSEDLKQCTEQVNILPSLLHTPLGSLSGGQFQRALVAFALTGNTNVLLFDEPTTGIDKPGEEQIYGILHRLQEERGMTVITISHDLTLVSRYADKVLCLNKQKACFGIPEETLIPETLTNLYGVEHSKFFHHTHDHR